MDKEEIEVLPIKKEEDLELRMYNLVIYNISGIQAGIQSYHAGIEYAQQHFNDPVYQRWADKWKTVIIKNGGTTNDGTEGVYGYEAMKGSLNGYYDMLVEQEIKVVPFYEPDLNNAMTSIAFLVDERVFNRTLYPNFGDYVLHKHGQINTFTTNRAHTVEESYAKDYKHWCEVIGEKNVWLRDNIQRIGLANN